MITFLSKIIKFNDLQVLGIFRTDSGDHYHTLTLKKKKNNLEIISSSSYNDISDLVKSLNLKIPVLLVVDGKGVLNKKTDPKNEQDINWKKNIDFNTIYYTDYKVNNHDFISFCRKKPVDGIITEMTGKGLQIIDFYLGPLLAALLQPAINSNIVISNDTRVEFENGKLTEVNKTVPVNQTYTFADKTLSPYHIPLYGAAIHFFIKQKEISKNSSDAIKPENIVYQKGFNYFGTAMIVIFFLALLTSYTLIQYFSSQNIELNQQNVYSNQTYMHIVELEKQKEQKLKILNDTGQLSKNFLSYYVYELSRSVPATVQLSQINIFPVLKEIKANEKLTINSNFIVVKGGTVNELLFNQWLNKLKDMQWIKKFEIISLKLDKKNIQQFEIKILLNDF